MQEPKKWTLDELAVDARTAMNLFRQQRLDEPRARYSEFFEAFAPIFRDMVEGLPALRAAEEPSALLSKIIGSKEQRTAFRYLTAPPISEDDLRVLAESTLTASALKRDDAQARRVRDLVLQVIDPHRFPWIVEGRPVRAQESELAVVASAALVAASKVQTARRGESKKRQEGAVRAQLQGSGLVEVARRDIPLPDRAPNPGEFCLESKFGATRADIVVRLYDRRVMPIECKVSNSAVNSFKRVNHEALNKARAWIAEFGNRVTVPAVVLSGVFNPQNLLDAQHAGLSLFWAHRMDDLQQFIRGTRLQGDA